MDRMNRTDKMDEMDRHDFPPAIEDIIEENTELFARADFWRLCSLLLAITTLVSTITVVWMKYQL